MLLARFDPDAGASPALSRHRMEEGEKPPPGLACQKGRGFSTKCHLNFDENFASIDHLPSSFGEVPATTYLSQPPSSRVRFVVPVSRVVLLHRKSVVVLDLDAKKRPERGGGIGESVGTAGGGAGWKECGRGDEAVSEREEGGE